ncbi:MAG: cupin domain-containing protein [Acetobacteraceae bacterium]
MHEQRHAEATADPAARKTDVVVETADIRIVEHTFEPGDTNPWHYHSEVSDRFYCLAGLIGVETRQPAERRVLQPGESCEIPARAVHHAYNAGIGTSRYLLIQALGKFDFVKVD